MATANTGSTGNLTREEFKKMKEQEELRKSGAAMPEQDEEGNIINPHIPQYIRQIPWYSNSTVPTMKHQSASSFQERQTNVAAMDEDKRVVKRANTSGTKFRKGACENCGAMTHKKRDCLEKPRAKTAKLQNTTFGNDEVTNNVKLSFEAKNDQFRNYDLANYEKVHEYYDKLEEQRALAAKEKLLQNPSASVNTNEEDMDTDEELEISAVTTGTSTIQHGHNIRVREDLPKYLRNLDVSSAHYDPKARSMRENPYAANDPRAQQYSGDNTLRSGGLNSEVNKLNQFAWEMHEQAGLESNPIAQPSEMEHKYKEFLKKKAEAEEMKKAMLQNKYVTSKNMTLAKEYEGATEEASNAFADLDKTIQTQHKVQIQTEAKAPTIVLEESVQDTGVKRKREDE